MTTRIQTFDGNIGIGTNDPGSFRLNVVGGVKAQSLVVNGVTNSHIPIGLLGLWYGIVEEVPDGWHICDGTTGITKSDGNGTIDVPDLRERFIMGASTTPQVGQFGGNNTVSLTEANLPTHTHELATGETSASHTHAIQAKDVPHTHGGNTAQSNQQHVHNDTTSSNANHSHPSADSEVPHTHACEATNTPHSHTVDSSTASHAHSITEVYPNFAGNSQWPGQAGRYYRKNPQAPLFFTNTSTTQIPHTHTMPSNNVPHAHTVDAHQMGHSHPIVTDNMPHAHTLPAANMLHRHSFQQENSVQHAHTVPTVNVDHAHTGTTDSTGQGTAFTVTNPYYILAYIMKI